MDQPWLVASFTGDVHQLELRSRLSEGEPSLAVTPYLPRQLAVLDAELPSALNPVCVLVYDTQGVGPLIEHVCGRPGTAEDVSDGVAWFRLSNYLPTGETLVARIKDAAATANWIFVHAGCSILPEPVLHLMRFIADQEADTPRIIVVGEQSDVLAGNNAMRELFGTVGTLISLLPQS
jgi:hypothetical protein